MKKLAFISGAIFGSTFGLGALFKIMHWPGAGILLVVCFGVFSLIFVPTLSKFLYNKSN